MNEVVLGPGSSPWHLSTSRYICTMSMVMAHGNCSAPRSKAQPQTIPWGDRDANVTQGDHLRRVGLPSRCNPDMDMVEARGRQDWTVRLCGGKWT